MDSRRRKAYWICQITGWSVYAVVNVVFASFFRTLSWEAALPNLMLGALGLGLTHLYRSYVRRKGWVRLPLRRMIPRVLLASAGIALVMTTVMLGVFVSVFGVVTPEEFRFGGALIMLFNLSATMLLWSLIYFGLHYFWNYQRAEVERWKLESAVKDAELRALKAQINPHFLFNSLNSVRALIVEDPGRAQQAVTRLAGLLRHTLRSSARATTSLEEELNAVRAYLELEAVRLEERLRYEIDADAAALRVPVPAMLVQTLVENGIKHGVATRTEGGELRVTARMNGAALRLRVENTGTLGAEASPDAVGMRNARERLRLLFGAGTALTLTGADGKVVAEVVIPLEDRP
jgi:LytS/YehU family sensor histidine kinase